MDYGIMVGPCSLLILFFGCMTMSDDDGDIDNNNDDLYI
jgi:hypothetical protein